MSEQSTTITVGRHKHEPGFVEIVTEKVTREVWHASPVGGLCVHCHKALPKRRAS